MHMNFLVFQNCQKMKSSNCATYAQKNEKSTKHGTKQSTQPRNKKRLYPVFG